MAWLVGPASGMISICWSSQTFGRKLLTKENPDQGWKQSLNQSWRLLSAAQQAISINSAPQQFRRIKFSHFWSIFNNFSHENFTFSVHCFQGSKERPNWMILFSFSKQGLTFRPWPYLGNYPKNTPKCTEVKFLDRKWPPPPPCLEKLKKFIQFCGSRLTLTVPIKTKLMVKSS